MVGLVYKKSFMLSPFMTLLRYIQPVNPTLTLINPNCMIGFIQGATQSFLCCAVSNAGCVHTKDSLLAKFSAQKLEPN